MLLHFPTFLLNVTFCLSLHTVSRKISYAVIIHRLSYSAESCMEYLFREMSRVSSRITLVRLFRDAAWSIACDISRTSNARIKSTTSICIRDNGRNSRLQVSATCETLKSIAICLLSHCYCSRSLWTRALSIPDTADTGFHIVEQ